MATGANNNTEYVKGYTSIQWAYGKQTSWSLDELRQQLSLPIDRQQQEFLRLLNQRELAEDCARKAKARLVLSKLKNSSIRQPIRTFKMAEPVYIWRKFLPHTIYAGKRWSSTHSKATMGWSWQSRVPRADPWSRRWRSYSCGLGEFGQPHLQGIGPLRSPDVGSREAAV